MEHMILKAATTARDQGIFTAVISTSSVDREKDVVDPAGMVAALHKWVATGKQIPLAWNHSTSADQIIGSINPASAKDVGGEVVVAGKIDMDTDTGSHAWRLIKTGVVGFSFGYLVLDGSKRKGGGRNITALDIFEVTATPTPMNNDTRVLDFKADVKQTDAPPTSAQMRILDAMVTAAQQYIASGPDAEDAGEMADVLETLEELRGEPDTEDEGPNAQMEEASVAGAVKAEWTTAYVNSLPDSAFLYVEGGGSKDSDGKTTPRSLRHFPVRDASGAVDQAHVRNALARIPQSNLSQSVKDAAAAKAKRLLDSSKAVDVTGKEPDRARSVDSLRRKAEAVELEYLSGGQSLRKPPRTVKPAPPELLPLKELKHRMREEMLTALSGGITQ